MVRKALGWGLVVFLTWYLFTQPQAAGAAVNHISASVQSAFTSAATFLGSINL